MRTEKSRLRRSLMALQELMRRIRHEPISTQVGDINTVLRGHYAYYGVAGNLRSLIKVYRVVERYWRKMLCMAQIDTDDQMRRERGKEELLQRQAARQQNNRHQDRRALFEEVIRLNGTPSARTAL